MLPVNATYGPWPASQEINIAESPGNNHAYRHGGNNIVSSAMHWGPDPANDAWWRTDVKRAALQTTYAAKEHTFGLEWSQKYLFTYINSRLLQVLYTDLATAFMRMGHTWWIFGARRAGWRRRLIRSSILCSSWQFRHEWLV